MYYTQLRLLKIFIFLVNLADEFVELLPLRHIANDYIVIIIDVLVGHNPLAAVMARSLLPPTPLLTTVDTPVHLKTGVARTASAWGN
jgi:hypothetical protein